MKGGGWMGEVRFGQTERKRYSIHLGTTQFLSNTSYEGGFAEAMVGLASGKGIEMGRRAGGGEGGVQVPGHIDTYL